ncbi:hypothetical protein Z051_09635 [Rhodococcus rhodochrous KG-21]|uniref:Uncharacterized protein n=1 Tax=Rhodococcus rhodochrous KG-21 TaxID=1441923 RepID=A0A0M8PPK6_RHORH|nr:hypothetical protein Z051_09635 [Rhodococcus rhodochrous KG-21]
MSMGTSRASQMSSAVRGLLTDRVRPLTRLSIVPGAHSAYLASRRFEKPLRSIRSIRASLATSCILMPLGHLLRLLRCLRLSVRTVIILTPC